MIDRVNIKDNMGALVKHPEITSLFKYCPIGKNQLSALAQRKIWYSKPAKFNDPFDTKFTVTGRRHVFEQEVDSQKKSLDELLVTFQSGIENLGILSLASCKTNLLMWSHYASAHKGMCLEFKRVNNTALADDEKTKPMKYNNSYPSIQATSLLSETSALSNKIRILHTKSKHWEYEQEWRHIVEQGDKLYPWPAALTSVYFGCKADMSDINLVKSIITGINVKYHKAELYKEGFGIYFKEI
ncbi:DUF2971 domain-containing protein [Morganella morganii]|uniref:DUF2971 domain-containing protein n=1 Tax=Morganella morganii TaxID=582 RepID=UPI002023A067|nr:DUF2971 domain-containing protein [Morganella morganii]